MPIANIKTDIEHGALIHRSNTGKILRVEAPVVAGNNFQNGSPSPLVFVSENGGTALPVSGAEGVLRLTTGGADNDNCQLASGMCFDPTKGLIAIAKIRLDDEDACAFNFGFTDTYREADSALPYEFSTATLTNVADDAVLWFHDADATSNLFRFATSNGTTDSAILNAGATDENWHEYRIEVDPDGTCRGYFDGALIGTLSTVLDTAVKYSVYVGLIERGGSAADSLDIEYLWAWQMQG